MFERYDRRPAYGCNYSFSMGDPNTLATGSTTTGHQIQTSLRLADPPALSSVCLQLQAHPDDAVVTDTTVIAAHGDSVLVQVTVIEDPKGNTPDYTTDHFVYSAGYAAADPLWPPSLSLLPPYYVASDDQMSYSGCPQSSRGLSSIAIGIIHRGKDDELVVAVLTMAVTSKDSSELGADKLFLFRSGKWIVIKSPAITNGDPKFGVDSPVLEYVKLPVYPCRRWPSSANRNVCATARGGALKLVDIFPRCCCGCEGTTDCQRSHGACVVSTWTLRMDDMVWVKDGILDASEHWASGTYEGLPRLNLAHPMVSVDEPHVICFVMTQDDHTPYDQKTLWKVMVDMGRKTIQSFSCHPKALHGYLVPSNVSYYLNSCPTSNSSNTKGAQSKVDAERSLVGDDDAGNSILLKSSCMSSGEPAVQASEMLAALQEIPSYGLGRDDMLKAAYRILCHGNGRGFGTLLSLPPNLRKDWLLMEIKASED
ncbi:unnamed protein product [Urochloa decumbens]|uniref:DUF1618 domain-containing protein n=1 Tax=Urochloa decumbens TaxID=240449 RepID=A0ABC9B5G0_9POAL